MKLLIGANTYEIKKNSQGHYLLFVLRTDGMWAWIATRDSARELLQLVQHA